MGVGPWGSSVGEGLDLQLLCFLLPGPHGGGGMVSAHRCAFALIDVHIHVDTPSTNTTVDTHAQISTHRRECTYTHVHTETCTQCTNVHTCAFTHVSTALTQTYTHVHTALTDVHTRAHTHTDIHTRAHSTHTKSSPVQLCCHFSPTEGSRF